MKSLVLIRKRKFTDNFYSGLVYGGSLGDLSAQGGSTPPTSIKILSNSANRERELWNKKMKNV